MMNYVYFDNVHKKKISKTSLNHLFEHGLRSCELWTCIKSVSFDHYFSVSGHFVWIAQSYKI